MVDAAHSGVPEPGVMSASGNYGGTLNAMERRRFGQGPCQDRVRTADQNLSGVSGTGTNFVCG